MIDSRDKLVNFLEQNYPEEEFILADGLELAFVGVKKRRKGKKLVTCYDSEICLAVLMENGIGSYQDALEYFEYNVLDAWVGDKTPLFV
jgi:hypothetical protein